MRVFLDRFAVRLPSVALVVLLLLLVAGLAAVDAVLRHDATVHVQLEATRVAAMIESGIAVEMEALAGLASTHAALGRRLDDGAFATYAAALERRLPAFRRLWIADAAGRIVHDYAADVAAGTRASPEGDTAGVRRVDSAMVRARATGRIQIARPGPLASGDRGYVLVQPVGEGERSAEVIAMAVASGGLLGHLPVTSGAPAHVVVLAGPDTVIARVGENGGGAGLRWAPARVHLPGGSEWVVAVAHTDTGRPLRVAVWVVGLAAVGLLTAAVWRERHAASRTAERSRELERLSAELLRANRMKSEFLANVSHEFRTPLNAIVGFVELLRDGVYGELAPRQVQPVERVAGSAGHLRVLVDQVLDIAKMAAGRMEVHPERIDLRPFVLEVASEIEPLVNERRLALSIAVGASIPRVRTDPTHLRQILVNLLGNAVKFTPSGSVGVRARSVSASATTPRRDPATSEIRLATRSPDPTRPWIALQVSDTGLGISPADRDRIFDEFQQAGASPHPEVVGRGSGLGLAISRRLARVLGGDLTVESELGKGSTFTLWIPVHPADLVGDAARPTPEAALPAISEGVRRAT